MAICHKYCFCFSLIINVQFTPQSHLPCSANGILASTVIRHSSFKYGDDKNKMAAYYWIGGRVHLTVCPFSRVCALVPSIPGLVETGVRVLEAMLTRLCSMCVMFNLSRRLCPTHVSSVYIHALSLLRRAPLAARTFPYCKS